MSEQGREPQVDRVEPTFDEREATLHLLTSLEYQTRKRDRLLDELLVRYGDRAGSKDKALPDRLLRHPGFEAFYRDVAAAAQPFSRMVLDVYDFLSRWRATSDRKSSDVLVDFDNAKATFAFDLDGFPTEKFRAVVEQQESIHVMELTIPDQPDLASISSGWTTRDDANWNKVDPVWDMDFYDDVGFWFVMSHATAVLVRGDDSDVSRAAEIIDPIVDRVAALRKAISANQNHRSGVFPTSLRGEYEDLPFVSVDSSAHEVHGDDVPGWFIRGAVALEANLAIALSIQQMHIVRTDRDKRLEKLVGLPADEVPVDTYLNTLGSVAADYIAVLDSISPIVATHFRWTQVDRLKEFLALPFWKHRWYLYELWTLVSVLDLAAKETDIELHQLVKRPDGGLVWKLPGGDAREAVASIGNGPGRLLAWSQRKTLHPKSGKGLEPDLRITRDVPEFHDVLIIENKDRITLRNSSITEILGRYVGGTCAESTWLINFESLPTESVSHEDAWPDRNVRVVGDFRPGNVPAAFESDIRTIIRTEVVRKHPPKSPKPERSEPPKAPTLESPDVLVTLSWSERDADLDLHGWITRSGATSHISYLEMGNLDEWPAASLEADMISGGSRENILVRGLDFDVLDVAVHAFTEGIMIAGSDAKVEVRVAGQASVTIPAPVSGEGRWWEVIRIEAQGKALRFISRLTNEMPGEEFAESPARRITAESPLPRRRLLPPDR